MSTKRVTRREFLHLAGGVSGAVLLAACSGGEAPQEEEPSAEVAVSTQVPSKEEVTIKFVGWPTSSNAPAEWSQAQLDKFYDETGITIEGIHSNEAEKLLTMVAAGTAPDASRVDSNFYRSFTKAGALHDITDLIESDPVLGQEDYFIQPQERDRCAIDGRWYGIGSCWVCSHLYYNADIFEEAGIEPPSNDPEEAWEWDHFLEVARQLTVDENGNHPGENGFDIDNVVQWGILWPTYWMKVHGIVRSNNGLLVDPETDKLAVDMPESLEAIQRVADLVLVDQVRPNAAALEALGMSSIQMLDNGRAAMAMDGSWSMNYTQALRPTLGTAVPPKMKTTATDMRAHLHSVMAASEHPEAAWKWVRWLSSDWFQEQYCKIGLWLPSHTSLMTEEAMDRWLDEGVHPPGYEKIATEFMPNYGHVQYLPMGWQKVESVLNPVMDKVWIGDATAAEAIPPVVPECNEILEEEAARA